MTEHDKHHQQEETQRIEGSNIRHGEHADCYPAQGERTCGNCGDWDCSHKRLTTEEACSYWTPKLAPITGDFVPVKTAALIGYTEDDLKNDIDRMNKERLETNEKTCVLCSKANWRN